MEFIYPLFVAFILVFVSELGDKTQLLVLSFSSKLKTITIILGVALGSLLSHGIAIIFGGILGNIENVIVHKWLDIITYSSFIFFGILTLIKKQKEDNAKEQNKLLKLQVSYTIIIALSIAIGELGDKTFLASIGLRNTIPELQNSTNSRCNFRNDNKRLDSYCIWKNVR